MDSKSIADSYSEIRKQIQNHSKSGSAPLIVAVSKNQTLEKIIALARLGQKDFGENYVQELVTKKQALAQVGIVNLRFHFIGQLQRNKVKTVLPMVVAIHSLDSIRLADEIQKCATELNRKVSVWIQVNIDEEESKSGFLPKDLKEAVPELLKRDQLSIEGWMCVPDPALNAFQSFKKMHTLADDFKGVPKKFSMGMSSDYLQAIQAGTDVLRLGTVLFGSRS